MNSPVRVSTVTRVPWSMCSGIWMMCPVSSVAALVRPVAELPLTPGDVSVTYTYAHPEAVSGDEARSACLRNGGVAR